MEAFGNDQRLFKRNDYRCLKPSDKKPEEWTYYEMKGFRAAKTEEQLNNVQGTLSPSQLPKHTAVFYCINHTLFL